MKRLFFVFLFALTALFFYACSSSSDGGGGDNPPAPISGNVIIPSDYSSYAVYVCSDADRSNSCSDAEPRAKANSDGSFAITASAALPLVAEFYETDPITVSGASVSSLGGIKPKLVYTTPAGKTTISAFTTMVKNKVDLSPAMTVGAATAEVASASGITDPFDAESYTAHAAVHDVVTGLAEGLLDYINTQNYTVNNPAAVIAALYNIIFDLLVDENIADNPGGVDVTDLVSGAEGGIEQAIEDADAALDPSGNWDLNTPLTLYEITYDDDDDVYSYRMSAFQTGPIWTTYDEVLFSQLDSYPNSLPPSSGASESFTLTGIDITPENAVKTSAGSISTTARYRSRSIPLSASAEVYTMLYSQNFAISKDSTSWHGNVNIIPTGSNTYKIEETAFTLTMDETDMTFNWVDTGNNDHIFRDDFAFDKQGTYTRNNAGTNEERYTFTADDGSIAEVFHNPDRNPSMFYMNLYAIQRSRLVLFNAVAAKEIRIWLEAHPITPLW
jgi:hypothetical protein